MRFLTQIALRAGIILRGRGHAGMARRLLELVAGSRDTTLAPVAAYELGVLLVESGNFATAADAFRQALALGEEHLAGRAAMNLGLLVNEEQEVRSALRLMANLEDPALAGETAYFLGILLSASGENGESERWFDKAAAVGRQRPATRARGDGLA